ncbi:hypothetical protein Taro_054663, partial [Colocasia esculenta]|nr:hypothetical protein [Colocasia esculenta]
PLRVVSASLSLHDIFSPLLLRYPAKRHPSIINEELLLSGRREDKKKRVLVVVLPIEVCPGVGTVVVVVCEQRLTGCGLTHVVCPVVGKVVSSVESELEEARLARETVHSSVFKQSETSSDEVFVRGCDAKWVGSWAQSAHRSYACERNKGLRRVLNAIALVVAFRLPLFGGLRLHGSRVSCAGQSADVSLGKATTSYVVFSSRHLLGQEELLRSSLGRFGILEWVLARSHLEDVAWSGGDTVPCSVCTFFMKEWACRVCDLQVWCWLVSTVLCLVLVERQLEISSVTTRLRGSSCVVLSGLDAGVMNQSSVCPGVGTVVVVVCERRLIGCGLTHVVCPIVGIVVSWFYLWWSALWWHWFGCGIHGGTLCW